ncbi:Di-copper centre-containing protein [Morchella conica CCBAS932]|uniref:tyrosinase n=1 Tax=Morchella conica CCBAS932 TaxID=1392247 RepID=A0A3N4K8D0_9PEZI|nr:Di-copper centre-containing protein [Morchella conica CCBAS932]
MEDYAIEGTGDPNTRLDIDDFSTNPEYTIQWGLFLRSLAKLQLAPPEEAIGYYRIAGIHGWPLVTWPELEAQPGKTMYCSHGNTRFLTWHRAYLLLIEQRIVEIALELAAGAPPALQDQYTEEAKKIRVPIWDWACKPALPASMVKPDALVIIPENDPVNPTSIPNPLYSYKSTGDSRDPFINETTRFPDDEVEKNMINSNLRSLVYHAITQNKEYNDFSNTISGGASSIEQPHNNVHNAISAIMQDPMVTAFDPVFWVVHVAIDYYYVMWQTINPDVLYSDNWGTDTLNLHLRPFNRAPPTGPWTSRMVQRSEDFFPTTWQFGFQYPETLVDWTPDQRLKAVQDAIKRYAPPPKSTGEYPPGATKREDLVDLPGYRSGFPDEATFRREWRVVIKVKKNLLDSNFTIFFFLGQSSDNPGEWGTHPNTVGSFNSLKAPLESCKNCQDHEAHLMHGSIYLTDRMHHSLPDGTQLHDKEPVSRWLTERLDWRIRKADGTEFHLPGGDTTSLSVGVESFMEAYAPIDRNRVPIESDDKNILGHTFDHEKHPMITAPRSSKGGDTIS